MNIEYKKLIFKEKNSTILLECMLLLIKQNDAPSRLQPQEGSSNFRSGIMLDNPLTIGSV